jgi:hypothetical protein
MNKETRDVPGTGKFSSRPVLVDGLGSKPSACVASPPSIRLGICDLARVTYRSTEVMPQR